MIGIFADQDMGDHGLGRQPTRGQPSGRRRLHYAVCAGPAGIFGTTSGGYPELGRDHVEPPGDVLANAVQTAAAATDQAFGFDDLLDPRQMPGKRTTFGAVPLGRSPGGAILSFFLGVDGRDGRFQIFQRQFDWSGSLFSDRRPKPACLKAATSFSNWAIRSSLR